MSVAFSCPSAPGLFVLGAWPSVYIYAIGETKEERQMRMAPRAERLEDMNMAIVEGWAGQWKVRHDRVLDYWMGDCVAGSIARFCEEGAAVSSRKAKRITGPLSKQLAPKAVGVLGQWVVGIQVDAAPSSSTVAGDGELMNPDTDFRRLTGIPCHIPKNRSTPIKKRTEER